VLNGGRERETFGEGLPPDETVRKKAGGNKKNRGDVKTGASSSRSDNSSRFLWSSI